MQKAILNGTRPHPANIVKSVTMAALEPPDVTYAPEIARTIVEEGRLSDVQIEAITYMGQATEQRLGDGSRREFWLGDGTYTIGGARYVYDRKRGVYVLKESPGN